MGNFIGYARVSTKGQDLNLQLDALEKAGCDRRSIYRDCASGAKSERPGLEECLASLKEGDTLLVWRLDRLGRSMQHLVKLVSDLCQKGIGFRSLCDGVIDTTSATGELIFNILCSLAQFERRLTQERCRAGLDAARARGRLGGRPAITSQNPKVLIAKSLHKDKNLNVMDICKELQISRPTFYRYLKM